MTQGKKKMRVSEIRLQNVLGLKNYEMEPGQVTIISGKNGRGKTSVIEAAKTAIGGGTLAEIKNVNADGPAEIVLRFGNDESDYIIKKTEKTTTVKRQIGDSMAYETVKAPQQFLNKLQDLQLSNPVKFLEEKSDKKRVHLMLEALPLQHVRGDMVDAAGVGFTEYGPVAENQHPLHEIAMYRDNIFSARTGVNRDKDAASKSAEKMMTNIPAEPPEKVDVSAVQAELRTLETAHSTEGEKIAGKKREALRTAENEIERAENVISGARDAADTDAKRKCEKVIAEAMRKRDKAIAENAEIENRKRNEARETIDSGRTTALDELQKQQEQVDAILPDIAELEKQIESLQRDAEEYTRFAALRTQAEEFSEEAGRHASHSARLTAALKAIDAYKAEICSNLPVQGLDITGNNITVNDVPWGQLNTAQQVEIATTIACLRADELELPLVFIDGAEMLDSENLELLRRMLEKHNVQALIGRVSDKDLEVEK